MANFSSRINPNFALVAHPMSPLPDLARKEVSFMQPPNLLKETATLYPPESYCAIPTFGNYCTSR
ncbi:hypothetical protein I7I53_04565 [Histoplasma capsulatum var. duboisii H88]|uniref:Uncharacterized protein n=1 Tax=Ajellomyces capsulatus (strain H88) TaxID=544711 RepID=A0A8A1LT92_AJEC8|nr:hypothetical protein I7I53_04565 [Histoplasma capsulatum var. duboisii H88]